MNLPAIGKKKEKQNRQSPFQP